MRIAICDDLPEQVEKIKTATIEYFNKQHQHVDIEVFHQAFALLDAFHEKGFDLVLLDIVMPGLLGTDVAREIRTASNKTEIIFLTTSGEFAIEAFEVNASHYLLKPIKPDLFKKAMDRVMTKRDHNSSKLIHFKGPKGIVQTINKDMISYIEANAHHQFVHLLDATQVETVQTLSELFLDLNQLSPGQFITPFKGYIVNQHAIASIESDQLILKSGIHIPIARRTFHAIKKNYFDYMFKETK